MIQCMEEMIWNSCLQCQELDTVATAISRFLSSYFFLKPWILKLIKHTHGSKIRTLSTEIKKQIFQIYLLNDKVSVFSLHSQNPWLFFEHFSLKYLLDLFSYLKWGTYSNIVFK